MYDLLIKNASIVDGSGAPAYSGIVAVAEGRLKILQKPDAAEKVIDASGLVLCPGFIDSHSHGDRVLGADFGRLCKTSQGITTEIVGQCGSTCFPVTAGRSDMLKSYLGALPEWISQNMDQFTSFGNYLKFAQKQPLTANCLTLTGHTALRIAAMGYDKRKPSNGELQLMKDLLRESLEHGSMGLSSGLLYSPSGYADEDEIAALCEVVAEYDGIYTTHMRDESSKVVESVKESLDVVQRTGVRLFISHHKICGQNNWGLSRKTLELIDAVAAKGYSVTYDVYPYTASMSKLSVCLPAYCFAEGMDALRARLQNSAYRDVIRAQMASDDPKFDGRYRHCGGWGGILISRAPSTPQAEGLSVADYAAGIGKNGFDAFFDILISDGNGAYAIYYSMCDDDLFRIMRGRNAVVGSDGIVTSMDGKTHPRGWGSFPRALKLYSKDNSLFRLEEIIHKMTFLTAERLRLKTKGMIADGFDADLVLLDYNKIADRATYAQPTVLSDGIEYVIVNGKVVYHDKKLTGINSGRFLLRP